MQTFENQQPSLLELIEEVPRIALAPVQKAQLATLSLHRALFPTFPAGAMVFFIPSRGGAEGSSAAHLDRQLTRTRRLVGAAAADRRWCRW